MVLAQIDEPTRTLEFYRPIAAGVASRIAEAEGRLEAAERYAESALQEYKERALEPTRSGDVGEIALLLATIKMSHNDQAAAETQLNLAIPALTHGFGAGHSLTKSALALRDQLAK